MKYRRKICEVEAWKLEPGIKSILNLKILPSLFKDVFYAICPVTQKFLPGIEIGDFIVRFADGSYQCWKPEEFHKEFEHD